MHFLLGTLGSAGDVHPFIVIAQALQRRGHDVRLLTSPYFADRIARAGIDFRPLGTIAEYEQVIRRAELWNAREGSRLILDELLKRLREGYEATLALTTPDTILVGSTLSWSMRLVQERRGLPGATVHLSPLCLASAIEPPVLPGIGDLSWMPSWALRLLLWLGERVVLDRSIGPRLNAFRAQIGLAPVAHIVTRWMHSPDLVIGAWPDWFARHRRDWPPKTITTGFPIFDDGGLALDPSLRRFLDAGEKPVGITPGSAMAHGDRFFARALDACATIGRRAVLVTPYADRLPRPLPDWAHHTRYAPFSALLPRLAALVHHGGIGTSAQALAAGVPHIVVPFAHDQFDNAARLRRLGVATTVAVDRPSSDWVTAMRAVLDRPSVNDAVRQHARRMADATPAADMIASHLETLATNEDVSASGHDADRREPCMPERGALP